MANHNLSDDEIIKIANEATNGNLFKALWNSDTSGYSSQSEAEQALANILAFYCGNDFYIELTDFLNNPDYTEKNGIERIIRPQQ